MRNTLNTGSDEPDVWTLLLVAKKFWRMISIMTICGFVAGYFLCRWELPVYSADALIQIETGNGGTTTAPDDIRGVFGTTSKAETEIEILQSRAVIQPAIETLNIKYRATLSNKFNQLIGRHGSITLDFLSLPKNTKGTSATWQLIGIDNDHTILVDPQGTKVATLSQNQEFSKAYGNDSVKIKIRSISTSKGERFSLSIQNIGDISKAISAALLVKEKGKNTGILQLNFTDQDPQRAALILNAIIASYLRTNNEIKSRQAKAASTILRQELPEIQNELFAAESELKSYRLNKGTADLSTEAYLALQQQVQLTQKIIETQQQRQELMRLYEDNHPQVIAMNSQIKRLQDVLDKSTSEVKSLPKTQQDIIKLTRDVSIATESYQKTIETIRKLDALQAGYVGSARLLDSAQIASTPIPISKQKTILTSGFAAASIAFGLALIYNYSRNTVTDCMIIQQATQAIAIVKIKKSASKNIIPKNSKNSVIVHEKQHSAVQESIRTLMISSLFALEGASSNIISITGLAKGVGTSFLTINLAVLLANSGRKVLVIDGNLRQGDIHKNLDTNSSPGLSDILSSSAGANLAKSKIQTFPNVEFLPTGKLSEAPTELLLSQKFENLLAQARDEYEIVLVGTPPLKEASDAAIIINKASLSLIITEHAKHSLNEMLECIELAHFQTNHKSITVINKYKNA